MFIGGKNTEAPVKRLIFRMNLMLRSPPNQSRGKFLFKNLQVPGTLFDFIKRREVHDLAVEKDFFPAVFSTSPHMGSRDIAVPEPKTLIAAGQHVLTFKTPFIPAGYYGGVADFVVSQAALRLIAQILKRPDFLDCRYDILVFE